MTGEGRQKPLLVILVLLMLIVGGMIMSWRLAQQAPMAGTSQPLPKQESTNTVTLLAVGDIMLARSLNTLTLRYGDDYPFVEIQALLRDADLTFGNLESPISGRGRAMPGKQIAFRGRPVMAQILAQTGFDVLSVANNHAVDYDSEALEDTLNLLWEKGVAAVGAGENIDEARQPVIIEKDGVRVGFLAYTIFADTWFHAGYKRPFRATEERSGVAPLEEEMILEDLAALKPRVDIVVISLHWGVEYQHTPQPDQVKLAHRLIDQGATLIIGHHPHVIQGVERYNNGLIAYSLGNFVFDQNNHVNTRQGLILQTRLAKRGVKSVSVLPVFIDKSQPYQMTGPDALQLLSQVNEMTRRLGTRCLVENDCLTIPFDSERETASP
ncbi:MAG: CapA family protein [Solirubrobacterales bacterium]